MTFPVKALYMQNPVVCGVLVVIIWLEFPCVRACHMEPNI
jgi:hypothetical protein